MNSPQAVRWHSLPGPDDITQVTLDNGITVLSRPNPASQTIVMAGYLTTGSLLDPEDRLGLALFTSISLLRGNHRRSFQQIFDCLESAGASLSIGASVHTTSFGGRSLAEDLPLLLELLSDSLREPTFPAENVERLRTQMLTSLAIRQQDTGDRASLAFDEILFPGHPYAHPEDGFPETIQRITRQDMIDFHSRTYGPGGMVITIVGGIEPGEAVEAAARALGDWTNPLQQPLPDLPPISPLRETVRHHTPLAGKSQTDLIMGNIGPSRLSPDYMAASIGNNILGQFGMMGRIGEAVREKSGLAYHASASLNTWIAGGSWDVSAGVNPANLDKAISLIRSELSRFISEPVSAEELADTQQHYIGRMPLSFESNNGVAHAILKMVRFNLGLDYYHRYPQLVRQVTPADVLEVAQRYINPDCLAIVSAGAAL